MPESQTEELSLREMLAKAGITQKKIGEDSWIKVLILMHLFCSEPLL
ncbi:MAG: hypothetical protein KGY41_04410 [Desulfovermiculus sp.]|nr:hypothetical protein [Desulfovermiculus sp.]